MDKELVHSIQSGGPVFGLRDRGAGPPLRTSFSANTERGRRFPAPRRYRAGFVTRSSFHQRLLRCQSPSTDSTTSLAQLRDKLSILSPIVFTKVPAKIATTPELPALKEENEFERSSISEPRTRRGVALRKQYHSDTETHTLTKKKTRYLEPVVEEHSASLTLIAALGPTDNSEVYEAFEQLYRSNPRLDLADLLVEEAIKHGQDKDSGVISGKLTQDSDIVEDTPNEEPTLRKKRGLKHRSKKNEDNKYSTDESDVVDDTPCYDYDRRNRVQTRSNKANNDEIEALNDEAIDDYFGKQTNEDLITLISPASIRNISESHCQNDNIRDRFTLIDNITIVEEDYPDIIKEINEGLSSEHIINKDITVGDNEINKRFQGDIVDCVNNLLDKVCHHVDLLLSKQQQQNNILRNSQITCNSLNTCNILKNNKNLHKSPKHKISDQNTECAQNVTLRFKPQKQLAKMNTSRQKKNPSLEKPKNTEEDGLLKENTNITSPPNTESQLIRKKRKLYSPKDDETENNEIPKSRKQRGPSTSATSPIAVCYKELENARKSRIRLPKKRTSLQPLISPNTKKLNDMFDKIKDNVVNGEKVTLVDKKNEKEICLYNMSSESDDEVFKKKKIQIQKRISSSSLESSSKLRRSVKPVNYTPYYSSEDECVKDSKPKPVKRTKPRSRKVNKIRRNNLVDERMRKHQPEILETSFVQGKGDTNISEEPEPTLQEPVLEAIPDDIIDESITAVNKPETPSKVEILKIKTEKGLRKRCKKLKQPSITNRSDEIVINAATDKGSATVSPLPGLVVETEQRKDDLTSSLDATLLQRLKQIYTEVDDMNTTRDTQNLVLNNNNDELEVDCLNKTCSRPNVSINMENFRDDNMSHVDLQSVVVSEKSFATTGRSPITGHNNPDESPPNLDALVENFEHRDVDFEGKSRSIAEFLLNMRNQIINSKANARRTSPVIPISRISTKSSARSNVSIRKISKKANTKTNTSYNGSEKSEPRVILERMSPEDIKRVCSLPPNCVEKAPDKSYLNPLNISSDSKSIKSIPKIILKRMSSEDIESLRNSLTPKSKASSKVLSKIFSEQSRKIVAPRTLISTTTESSVPVVVIDRVSSYEINKWLPMPKPTEDIGEPKKIRKISNRRRSVPKPCITCINIEPSISPVKLNFDVQNLTSPKVTRNRTRSIQSINSRTRIEKLRTESEKSAIVKDSNDEGVGRQETLKSVEADYTPTQNVESTVDPKEMSKSLASVQSWMKRNAAARSSKTDEEATKEALFEIVMETLNNRLVEMNESTGEAIQEAMLKDHEEVTRLEEKVDRIKAEIVAFRKSKMERACALVQQDAQNKATMVRLLKEDIQRLFK